MEPRPASAVESINHYITSIEIARAGTGINPIAGPAHSTTIERSTFVARQAVETSVTAPSPEINMSKFFTNVVEITKRFTFEAHHKLPYHDGKCARDHGHSYIVEVSVLGHVRKDDSIDPESGMVMDFYRLGDVMKPLIENTLDHYSLNDLLPNPTAENLCMWLVEYLSDEIDTPEVEISRVRVYETVNAWVEWSKVLGGN